MEGVLVMVNGLPGNMAKTVCRHVIADPRFDLLPFSLTGPEITDAACDVEGIRVELIVPQNAPERLQEILQRHKVFITVDYTHPSAVNANGALYCSLGLPFVMGTTGGDRRALALLVEHSQTSAVIAPNMAKQIVGFTAMMDFMATNFPGIFKGWELSIQESHQKGKADTSGTARAMVKYFNAMGADFSEEQIEKERDPQTQATVWGVPKEYLKGHAYHTYSLVSPDKTVKFAFSHNVNGREIYASGTMDAIAFLAKKIQGGVCGMVYSMEDVLKNA